MMTATPSVTPEVFALVKSLEAVVVAEKFTIDGRVFVCKRGDVPFELPLEIEAYEGPQLIPAKTHTAVHCLYKLVQEIHSIPTRQVPPTRDEYLAKLEQHHLTTKGIRFLVAAGLGEEVSIPLHKESKIVDQDGKPSLVPVGARACVIFTKQGRSYVRENIDPAYGLAGKHHWDSVKELADRLRAALPAACGGSDLLPGIPGERGDYDRRGGGDRGEVADGDSEVPDEGAVFEHGGDETPRPEVSREVSEGL